jgi:hypothetical protein
VSEVAQELEKIAVSNGWRLERQKPHGPWDLWQVVREAGARLEILTLLLEPSGDPRDGQYEDYPSGADREVLTLEDARSILRGRREAAE